MKKLMSLMLVILVAGLFAACGDDNKEPNCDGKGGIGQACDADCPCTTGTCTDGTCVDEGDCCPGQALHVTVDGMAVDLATQTGVQADVAALAPLTALSGDIATHEAETSAGADGVFSFSCFDAAGISLGLILLADDAGYDGAGGNFFPTVSGIASWPDNNAKVCEEGAKAMVVNATLLGGLEAALGPAGMDAVGVGFIIGSVVDANRAPLAGATVARSDGNALTVYYPNADFSDFQAETAAGGVYIVIDQLSLTALIGVLDGYVWEPTTFKAATIPGAAYFVPLVADAQ